MSGSRRTTKTRLLTGAYHNGYRGNGARIAVLDTGIDLDHPDLVASIDLGDSKNCVTPGAPPEDGYGHGTHVAGTAAAPRNGIGVVGVASEAELVAVKVFDDSGNSSESLVLCGFDHVMALNADGDSTNDIDVMNMSFGEERAWGDCQNDALHAAVCAANAAGIIMVAGAGNSAVNAGNFVPAAFPEVISVSALTDFDTVRGGLAGCKFILELFSTECDDTLALFSNYGASVDVVAPGVFVQSTWPGGTYKTSSGTSMATPHVAGVVALMAAAAPGLTPAQAMANLKTSGECPDGSIAGADASCAGQGTWPDDPDGIPEPMIHALRAAVASGNPPPPTAPGAPNLTAATAGNASVALTWSAPASDGGSPISGYQIWRGTSSGGESLLTTVGVTTSYTDSTVSNGTTYYYQVAAVNAVGPGPGSNERSATPAPPPPPTAPGAPNLTAATAGNASVALTWSAPASDGGSPISGYQIWRGTSSGGESLLTTVGVTTSYTDSTVSNGTTYYYQVAAVNAVGTGPGSNERSATPTGLVPVTRLGGAAGTFASSNSGSMSFSLPAGTDRLVAMISVYTTSTTVTSMTWKPDPGNPSLNQPLTFVGRQVASANGAVEIWELANPTPGVAGAALSHTLSANAKRVIGVHALAGVGGHGTPGRRRLQQQRHLGQRALADRRPRARRHLRLQQHHRPHRGCRTDRALGPEHHRRHQQPARRRLVRGRGGHDHDELDVGLRHPPRPAGGQLQPGHPLRATAAHRPGCSQPDRRQRRQRQRGADLERTGLRRRQPDQRLPDLARHEQRRREPADHGRGDDQLHRLHRQQRHDLLLPGRRGQRRRHRSGLQRAQRHAATDHRRPPPRVPPT